jgi:SAM-dependent methyltransferase
VPGNYEKYSIIQYSDTSFIYIMIYSENQVKEILDTEILPIYKKKPVVLLNIWDKELEQKYIDSYRAQYEKILLDFNNIFPDGQSSQRILEISSFLGVVDLALAKIGFLVYSYDIPEFQNNPNLKRLYTEFDVHPSSGFIKDVGVNGLPYPENFFDAILLSEVLEHLNVNPLPILQEINRILKKDGILYITTKNQVNLTNRIRIFFGGSIRNPVNDTVVQIDHTKNTICGIHWREYTAEEVTELLEVTGFSVYRCSFSEKGKENTYVPSSREIFFRTVKSLYRIFPRLNDSIIIIGKKKEFVERKFWSHPEYIKYYPNNKKVKK